jgi:hypothetical protein
MSDQQPTGPIRPASATDDPRVDAALTPLNALDDTPVDDHPEVIDEVHRALQDILAEEQD